MSKMPRVKSKPKYNHNDPFRWVDAQWEKFMTEQKEHRTIIKQLQEDLAIAGSKDLKTTKKELIKNF